MNIDSDSIKKSLKGEVSLSLKHIAFPVNQAAILTQRQALSLPDLGSLKLLLLMQKYGIDYHKGAHYVDIPSDDLFTYIPRKREAYIREVECSSKNSEKSRRKIEYSMFAKDHIVPFEKCVNENNMVVKILDTEWLHEETDKRKITHLRIHYKYGYEDDDQCYEAFVFKNPLTFSAFEYFQLLEILEDLNIDYDECDTQIYPDFQTQYLLQAVLNADTDTRMQVSTVFPKSMESLSDHTLYISFSGPQEDYTNYANIDIEEALELILSKTAAKNVDQYMKNRLTKKDYRNFKTSFLAASKQS